jgi:phosphoglycerate dehydrogenase-like enzyme
MIRVLLLESLHSDAERLLATVGDVLRAESPDEATAARLAVDVDAILTRGRGRITSDVLRAGTRLRCVARAGSGLDNVDVAEATALRIPVVYAPDAVTETTAEHTLALLLAVARDIPAWSNRVKAGRWTERATAPLTFDLSGRTLGVIGLGRIGTRVAEMATALGMRVIYASRSRVDARFERVSPDALLARSDAVTVHTDLNASTRHLLNAEAFARMRPGVVVVNTSRGAVVDEGALVDALRSGKVRGYAADVLSQEPPAENHPLFAFDNVVLTPHSAALTEGAYRRMCLETAENVAHILRGEPPDTKHVRNPQVLETADG